MAFNAGPITSEEVEVLLAPLLADFRDLAGYLLEISVNGAWQEPETGTLLLKTSCKTEWRNDEVALFPPIPSAEIDGFQRQSQFQVPKALRHFYRLANGVHLAELSVFGIAAQIDRSKRAPFDIGMGQMWRVGYAACDENLVLIGSENVSMDGQVGYFMTEDGAVVGRGNGQADVPDDFGRWESMSAWLNSRLGLSG